MDRPSADETGEATSPVEPDVHLQGTSTIEGVLDLVLAVVMARVRTSDGASAAVSDVGGRPVVVTTDEVGVVDLLQYSTGRGPCVDALRTSRRQHIAVSAGAVRWPEFAEAAAAEGFRSVLALPLRADGDTMGTVVLYTRDRFGPLDVEMAVELVHRVGPTVAAARALAGARVATENLRAGMTTRGLIGQAQGILMVRHRFDGPAAFAMLRRVSQSTNRRLRDVAAEIVEEHEGDVRAS